MRGKTKSQSSRVQKPPERTFRRGLKLGQEEWDRVLLETVRNMGQASAEEIAKAADLDVGRVVASLRRLAKTRKIRIMTEYKYGVPAGSRSKHKG